MKDYFSAVCLSQIQNSCAEKDNFEGNVEVIAQLIQAEQLKRIADTLEFIEQNLRTIATEGCK